MKARNICLALAITIATAMTPAHAQENFPTRPVTLVVGAAPGGPTDIVARLLAERMARNMKATFVVENRGGGGGVIAAKTVAQAAPDGHTLLMGSVSTHGINPTLYTKLGYDAIKDFAPISQVVSYPVVMVVNPSKLPVKNVAEYIALAKKNPGKFNRASAGNGTSMHLSGELFDRMAGVKTSHVPFKGSAPAVMAMLSGDADVDFESIPVAMPHIESGKLRALGVSSAKPLSVLKDVPAIGDTVPGYEISGWLGLLAPAGTPSAIVDRFAREAAKALADPDLRKKLLDQAVEPVSNTPAEFAVFIRKEIERLGEVVKASGATAD